MLRFDPCSPGSGWATRRPAMRPLNYPAGFDPCSPGSCWAASNSCGHQWRETRVSILVLLDQARRLSPVALRGRPATSFDPCSPGSGSGPGDADSASSAEAGFRSLFSWIRLVGARTGFAPRKAPGFRSLFFWIRLVGLLDCGPRKIAAGFDPCSTGSGWRPTKTTECAHVRVSILVLLDQAASAAALGLAAHGGRVSILVLLDQARRPLGGADTAGHGEFRSLFYWIMLGATPTPWTSRPGRICFDPCSPGSCLAARRQLTAPERPLSILVLLDHAGRHRPPQLRQLDGRQRFDPCSPGSCWATAMGPPPLAASPMFRSLSPGSCWATSSSHATRSRPGRVSILVLLDHAGRRLGTASDEITQFRVSNPCSLDHAGRRPPCPDDGPDDRGVSILALLRSCWATGLAAGPNA